MNTKTIHNASETTFVINPKKFVLWLIIVASVMLFAGFTSAYIVRRGEGNWELFNLPSNFIYSTIVIALSSVSMQLSSVFAKKLERNKSLSRYNIQLSIRKNIIHKRLQV